MCKRDTGSVKVAPESVLSNKGNVEGTHLTRGVTPGGLSPGKGYLRTPYTVIHLVLGLPHLLEPGTLQTINVFVESVGL